MIALSCQITVDSVHINAIHVFLFSF
uniref:Uncharacterized protein n=1 Tax=Rhizophora mucronata TaxID=61149 RepID=A0A2P2QJ61_RHIMU